MRKIPCVMIFMLLLVSMSFGQTGDSTQPATKEDVIQMFQEMRFEQQMKGIQQSISAQFQGMASQMVQRSEFKNVTPEKMKKYQEFVQEQMQHSMDIYPISEMMNDFAPVYAKHLTKADVKGITDFYHSPAGKKLLDVAPAVTQEAMAIIGPKMQDRLTKSMEDMQRRAREIFEDPSSDPNPQSRN